MKQSSVLLSRCAGLGVRWWQRGGQCKLHNIAVLRHSDARRYPAAISCFTVSVCADTIELAIAYPLFIWLFLLPLVSVRSFCCRVWWLCCCWWLCRCLL